MIFSYNFLKEYLKKIPKPEDLVNILTMHSFEVESLKKVGDDFVLDIEILSNRASDCFSHYGLAREISVVTGTQLKELELKAKENKDLKSGNLIEVEVKNKSDCSRYGARVITNVKIGPSPNWIKEKLKACGLRPINNIVDVTNYVMLETGQPIHAFDLEKISLDENKGKKIRKIIVRRARKGEKITSLDGELYNLDEDVLIISDKNGPLAIAGIKGGKSPEIDERTKTIVLESANFDRHLVRRASQKLKLRTDASIRFEHGLDQNLTELAINRAAYLIEKLADGKTAKGIVDFYPKKNISKLIKLDLNYLNGLLGEKISNQEVKSIFRRLNFQIIKASGRSITVKIPTYRLDLTIPEDLIEEVGRIIGYEKIKPVFPSSSLIPPKRNLDIFWEDLTKNILKEAGFTEVYNYPFFSDKEMDLFDYCKRDLIKLENPISEEYKYLRASLIPKLLKDVEKNYNNFKEIKIFELGKVFKIEKKDYKEKKMLGGLIIGDAFYETKGVIESMLNKLGISNVWYDEYKPTPEESKFQVWRPQKCAEIKIDGKEIGFLGEINPRIINEFKIPKVAVFDLNFEELIKYASEEHEYRPISRFPAVIRDLAILVPQDIRMIEVLNKIENAGGLLLRDVDLFDTYEGEELPEGQKNLAFHLIFQSEDHTMSSKEVDKIQEKIIKAIEDNSQWQVRR